MSPRLRIAIFLIACAMLLPVVLHVATRMPRFGDHPLPYGDAINARAVAERHVTNMVSAVNFDYRGIDTLGEEFMLLCAVTGTVILLRGGRGEQTGARPGTVTGRRNRPQTAAVVLLCRLLGPVIVLFGLYVVAHATATPGGGFQGGVIVATGLLTLLLGEGYRGWRRVVRSQLLDVCEGLGASLYALCGFAGMAAGRPFLTNIVPLGTPGDAFSGGLMLVENLGVACAVMGGFAVLFNEFLEETRAPEAGERE